MNKSEEGIEIKKKLLGYIAKIIIKRSLPVKRHRKKSHNYMLSIAK